MAFLVRKISAVKWTKCGEAKRLMADAITGCLRTDTNTLSVWVAETEGDIDDALLALLASLQEPAAIDYVVIEDQMIYAAGLQLVATDGRSAAVSLNTLHRDIVDLDHPALKLVAEIILPIVVADNHIRLSRHEVLSRVSKGVETQRVVKEKLHKKYQELIVG
jgi:hypothetical protein